MKEMRVVRTDDEATKADILLSGFSGIDPGGAIERQEARGQRAFVESDTLPIEGTKPRRGFLYDNKNPDASRFETMDEWLAHPDEAAFAALGFDLGPQVPGDELFRYARLPPGWTKAGTTHAMHSDILDERGRKRIGVFYKAAFYDRKAGCHIVRLEGPNGRIYDDHAFVPDPEPRPDVQPMCGFTYGPDKTYPSRCYQYESFRWHHAEADVPYGDARPDEP